MTMIEQISERWQTEVEPCKDMCKAYYDIAWLLKAIEQQQQQINELNREVEKQTVWKDGYRKQLADALMKVNEQQQQIEQQATEIERLKCCANCNWWNDSKFVGCVDADKDLFNKYNGRRCGKWTGRKEAQGVK